MSFFRCFLLAAAVSSFVSLAGCASDTETADDDEVASEADALAAGSLHRNRDAETVIVWSQNIRKRMERWENVVRCMGDKECNGLGAVPDVILLQEAGCEDTEAVRRRLGKRVAEGGLGITGWKKHCVENFSPTSGHWMSNGIVYRSDRFVLRDAIDVPIQTGNGDSCSFQGKKIPVVKLFDRARAAGGFAETHVTLAVRHDDHFGNGKDTCDTRDDTTHFCTWKNSKIIDRAIDSVGGGLLVMAGDWNYAAKFCREGNKEFPGFKHAYRCTTKGLSDTCDGGETKNLGWRDPLLENDAAVYDTASNIDFVHAKDTRGFVLNRTAKNAKPGVVKKCFYCTKTDGDDTDDGHDPARMSDHDARLVRIRY